MTAAVIGGAGVVAGAVIAAASSWWTTSLAARQARKAKRAERREAAYTEFMLSAETFHRVINDSETVPGTHPANTIGHHVAQAADVLRRSLILSGVSLSGRTATA